jgi:phospholipid-binding lipoprotein MlaA
MIITFHSSARSLARLLTTVLLVLFAAGCATMKGPDSRDPLEPVNRQVMKFNDEVDALFLKPVATAYQQVVPPLVRTGVTNFFGNFADMWYFVNSLLQLRLQDAEENFARVHINTIFGLGGIFDVASDLNIERHREDFGQTLGRWGVPEGPYIVLPFFGPSTVRDGLALWVDFQGDVAWELPKDVATRNTLYAIRTVDKRANLLRVGSVIDEAALDKYTFIRDAFLQRRRAEVLDFHQGSDSDGAEPSHDTEPAAAPTPRPPASQPAR